MAKAILLIGNHPPPFGGVPSHIQYLAPFLAQRGWDVHVLSLVPKTGPSEDVVGYRIHRPSRADRWRALLSTRAPMPRAASLSFALGSPKRFLGAVALAALVHGLVRKYAIEVISAYHLLPSALAASWVAREMGVPLVASVFGEIYAQPEMHRRRLAELRFVIETSARLLSCSKHCADSFQSIGLNPPVDVIYYGVDTTRFSPTIDGEVLRRGLGIPPEDIVVLFVGRMIREMGLHTLLQAIPVVLERVGNARFIVAGSRGELSTAAHAIASRLPGHVFVQPDVPADDLPRYYGTASMVVAPSSNARACLGLAIAEGMASGKAVIGCDVGGTREILSADETGFLVPPEDPAALAAAIVRLAGDRDSSHRMGARGRAIATQRFEKDQTNQRLERLFSELLHA